MALSKHCFQVAARLSSVSLRVHVRKHVAGCTERRTIKVKGGRMKETEGNNVARASWWNHKFLSLGTV